MSDFTDALNDVLRYGSDDTKTLLKKIEFDQDTKEGGPNADHTLRGVLADSLQEDGREVEAALLRDKHPVTVTSKWLNGPDAEEGKVVPNYPHHSDYGGYPLIYRSGSVFACPQCMNDYAMDRAKQMAEGRAEPATTHPKEFRVLPHYEGPPIECTECGREVESAYGDPDAPEDDQ